MNDWLINALWFIIGVIVGKYTSLKQLNRININPKNFILVVTTTAWAISIIAEIMNPSVYKTPTAVHGVMGVIIGSIFKKNFFGGTKDETKNN